MDYLWTPWRRKYVLKHNRSSGCVFCDVQKQEDGSDNLIVYRGDKAYVIMNRFPYSSGHIMAVPYVHKSSIEDLDRETRAEIMELVTKGMTVLRNVYRPEAFNVGANIGKSAGAGIASHVHFHVVPRWPGDTNFITTLGQTRVLPETLEDTYNKLRQVWGGDL